MVGISRDHLVVSVSQISSKLDSDNSQARLILSLNSALQMLRVDCHDSEAFACNSGLLRGSWLDLTQFPILT